MTGLDEMVGRRVNMLTVVEAVRLPGRRGWYYRCACDCGGSRVVYGSHLRSGEAKACGCLKGARRTHRMTGTPEYRAWENARDRCRNPKNRKYPLYGGRGIRMCAAWETSFEAFFASMGRRPTAEHSLDRIEGSKGYEPGNCRWATSTEQNNNRSINRHVLIDGRQLTVSQAARLVGIPHATILGRLDAGKSDEEAVRG